MAGCVNKVILIGFCGADPEVRQTQDGRSICNLRLATTDTWRDKQSGERREKTEWHSVAIFNDQLAKIAQQHLKKGAKIYIEGQLQTRKWQDSSGNDRYTTEVVLQNYSGQLTMLDSNPNSTFQSEKRANPPQRAQNSGTPPRNMAGRQLQGAKTWEDDEGALDDTVPW